jgi:hypothetical protein
MLDVAARFRDALGLIHVGRHKDACGTLRPVLEYHLGRLCAEKRVSPASERIVDRVHALYEQRVIDRVERGRFLAWNTLGNAGNHVGMERVEKADAEYFLAGLAGRLGVSVTVGAATPGRRTPGQPAMVRTAAPSPVAPRSRQRLASGDERHRQALIAAFYLSKFEHGKLGLGNQGETFAVVAGKLGTKTNTLKNYRDYFDPHTGSGRRGWWQVELPPQFATILEEFQGHGEGELRELVEGFLSGDHQP